MPIYEFECQSCGNEVEVLQKMSDAHITDCVVCGKAEMKKKVSAAAFRLRGAGWYETDFKSGDKKKNLSETDKKTDDDTTANNAKDTAKGASKDASSNSSTSNKSTKATSQSSG